MMTLKLTKIVAVELHNELPHFKRIFGSVIHLEQRVLVFLKQMLEYAKNKWDLCQLVAVA